MENHLQNINPWLIIENNFNPDNIAEDTFSMGNGKTGQSGNFEEHFSGNTNPFTYMSGIYKSTPEDNTLNGNVLSRLPDWTKLDIRLNTELVDLATCEILSYSRILNIKQGYLERNFKIKTHENRQIIVSVQRFLSLAQQETAAIKLCIRSINFDGRISFYPVLDGNFQTEAPEWNILQSKTQKEVAHLWIQTRKTNFQVCQAVAFDLFKNNAQVKVNPTKIEKSNVAGFSFGTDLKSGESVCVYKFVSIISSLDYSHTELTERAGEIALNAKNTGWIELFEENRAAWEQKWQNTDAQISQNEVIKLFREYFPKNN